MDKIRIADVAQQAGVSVSTVDRVLNGRKNTSRSSIHKVREAIRSLGYRALPPDLSDMRERVRIRYILPLLNQFGLFDQISAELARARQIIPKIIAQIEVVRVRDVRTETFAEELRKTGPEHCDVVCVFGLGGDSLSEAIADAVKRGLVVITLVADVPYSPRTYHVGVNNTAAGRTAADLVVRMAAKSGGDIAVISGLRGMYDQDARVSAFCDEIHGGSGLKIRSVDYVHADSIKCRATVVAILRSTAPPSALYVCGGAQFAFVDALREAGRPKGMVVIVHDLNDAVQAGLQENLIDFAIVQDAAKLTRSSVRTAVCAFKGDRLFPEERELGLNIVGKHNCPSLNALRFG